MESVDAHAPNHDTRCSQPGVVGLSPTERKLNWSMFDDAAACYDRVRPGYPDAAIEEAVRLANLTGGSRLLEIGCGTGQATLPFARLGLSIQAVERGLAMARLAQVRLTGFPNVEVVLGDFAGLSPGDPPFDALLAASSFDWLESETRVDKCASLLGDGAMLLLMTNVQRATYEGFFARARALREELIPEWSAGDRSPTWERIPNQIDEVDGRGLFSTIAVSSHDWRVVYPRDHFLEFLRTDPAHRELGERKLSELFKGLETLIDTEFEGRVVTPFRTILHVAQRTGLPVGASGT